MALDVLIQPQVEIPRRGGDYELILQLEDDGFTHFLAPFFEQLARTSGQRIDLYGDAAFGGILLEDLKQTFAAARRTLEEKPQHEMKEKLDKMEAAIDRAKATGSYITFWGD